MASAGTGAAGGGVVDVEPPGAEGILPCVDPMPLGGPDSGYVACAGHFAHRQAAHACPMQPCLTDEHCPGACAEFPGYSVNYGCYSPCTSDGDCGVGRVCVCDDTVNYCTSASCTTDADCGMGLLCVGGAGVCGGYYDFSCQTRNDDCTTRCPTVQGANGREQFYACERVQEPDGSKANRCVQTQGAGGGCGRPFLVAGSVVRAQAIKATDWSDPKTPLPNLDGLAPDLRGLLADHWRDAALMEHASIAAFARFTLELLALGAPAELVRDAASAMADEQRHATTCFALASAYAGTPVGPGALDVRGAVGEVDLESVVVTAFVEACVGETVAALEARELARRADDPVVERVLERIAEDEARHAALGWRFVRWALLQPGGAEVASRLDAELRRACERQTASIEPASHGFDDEVLCDNGVFSPARSASLRREALDTVVAPCLTALRRASLAAAPAADTVALHEASLHAAPLPSA
jgi:hypothetical protein